ncbi:MAG TPA: alkaline phosphatase D family protein, partial [Saprospiraceae bacterium]|nr:alkaline phosphatase D family protein [Saprospiraceae bacterium]
FMTTPIRTEAAHAFTAKCIADQVQPGRSYTYRVLINGTALKFAYPTEFKTQPLWQWRSDPPAFTLATGSCAYVNEEEYDRPGTPYGSDYQIFTSLAKQRPDLMLWLGDNVYYREPDWNTRTGMVHRYTHDRALPELQPLLASTAHYAIWDDHDYGPNDSDGTWTHKEMAWEVFRDFWGNPTFGVDGRKGCSTRFQYADVDFFLLDNRYFRSPNFCRTCTGRSSLGQEQMDWLIGSLTASYAPFKIVAVGGQGLTDDSHHETAFHFFPAERDTLLARIEREKIKGVVFLTGDRHFTELSAMKNKAGRMVYDLTTSSLTAGSFKDPLKNTSNSFRVDGTVVDQHNFSLLSFSGPRTARKMTISVRDKEGKELWTRTIEQE